MCITTERCVTIWDEEETMTRLQDMFTIRRDCFLPCGDTTRLEGQLKDQWEYFGMEIGIDSMVQRAPWFTFVTTIRQDIRQRIQKPEVFMFSPLEHKPTSPHPIYPQDFVFSDAADSLE